MDSPMPNPAVDEGMESSLQAIAIIGLAGRFPGADDVDSFWDNIVAGKESIEFYSDEELRQEGYQDSHLRDPDFVKAGATIKDAQMFDAAFFGYTPREALLMDPQQRLFLESAWHALENAGIDCQASKASIGVFAGTNPDNYMLTNFNQQEFLSASPYEKRLGSDSGFLATRVAYKLNLRGPAITVQTACSTSLVAVSMACQHLMTYQCDVALAGASTVQAPRKTGYIYQQHGISSPDGHCRPFDEDAQGTIGGEGVATVVLKRLEEALEDGDTIHAVVKSWAVNNDGDAKVGFTAPSVDGQAEVIEMAQALAGVSADSIGYIEAHGTGTELGDPIEIAALTQAFSLTTEKTNFCSIGSVKANIGHLDATAGIAGLIKATLMLRHKKLPPLVHYQNPNPRLNLASSPFYVTTQSQEWEQSKGPRRAGISSFGMGGTNAHVILEESPQSASTARSHEQQLLAVSARTAAQCLQAIENLAGWLQQQPQQSLADVAYTLLTGRKKFAFSAVCVAANHADAIASLRLADAGSVLKAEDVSRKPGIAFMFPGQGNQYSHMAADLYQSEPMFRATVDRCSEIIKSEFGYDLRQILYPALQQEAASELLDRTEYAQPALFVVEYALAKLLQDWGISADAYIGHSIGEYVAATLGGVFSLDDALKLVAHRGRLMQSAPSGSMAAIPLSAEKLRERLPADLSIAVINQPDMCVVSGESESINRFVENCQQDNMHCFLLHTSHAFHSAMMDGILDDFAELLETVSMSAPTTPFLSNLSGDWITPEQAVDPQYWAGHMRHPVRFSDGIQILLQDSSRLLFEVGPGNSLSSVAHRHPQRDAAHHVMTMMRHPREPNNDLSVLLESIGQAWQHGVNIDWPGYYQHEQRRKIALPGYPFERKPYWIHWSSTGVDASAAATDASTKQKNISNWLYLPSWQRQSALDDMPLPGESGDGLIAHPPATAKCWLLFADTAGLAEHLIADLERCGDRVVRVNRGNEYRDEFEAKQRFTLSDSADDFDSLLKDITQYSIAVNSVLYLWAYGKPDNADSAESELEPGFYAPLFLVKALGQYIDARRNKASQQDRAIDICFVSSRVQLVSGSEPLSPVRSTLLGVNRVCPQEMSSLQTRSIDFEFPAAEESKASVAQHAACLAMEISQHDRLVSKEREIAYRGRYRWLKTFVQAPSKPPPDSDAGQPPSSSRLRHQGVYLITGGYGGIGRSLAEFLAQTLKARLILLGRSALPERREWDSWLSAHEAGDPVSEKIRLIRMLEEKGARVLSVSCDVANIVEMKKAISLATAEFGSINAVIHSAGVPGGGLIQLKTRTTLAQILAPKVQGALVLDSLFDNPSLDFMLLCSSLAAISGGVGQVDYTAANIFLDSLAAARQQRGLFTVSVNWDTWAEVGMAVETEVPAEYQVHKQKNLDAGIRSPEGVELFCRVLDQQQPQVIISTRASFERGGDSAAAGLEHSHSQVEDAAANAIAVKGEQAVGEGYAGPRDAIETALCEIWQEMFGIPTIGIEDDFFDLGGHSLLAVQILSRVNRISDAHVTLNDFFDAVTIANLAAFISDQLLLRTDLEVEEITDEMVNALSDEEVARLLGENCVVKDE